MSYPYDVTPTIRHALRSRLLRGASVPLMGRLMMDTTADGAPVLIDPVTAEELSPTTLPAFILSTDGNAEDGNILRQHWDLSRADTVGIPVIWSHNPRGEGTTALLGSWRDLGVRDIGGRKCLVGRSDLDMGLTEGATAMGQIRRGYLRAVSVGWRPGMVVRRGALDITDPAYLPPVDDECGYPDEGLVMGSPEAPNALMECSLCAVPSDPAAFATERLYAAAERAYTGSGRDGRQTAALDMDAFLVTIRDHAGAQAFLRRMVDQEVARRLAPSLAPVRTVADLFPSPRST